MNYLSEENSKLLLNKEWLVRIDSENSTPYLLKFYSSMVDLSCCILITDTRNVWGEVLTSKQFARRWRDCNPLNSSLFPTEEEEDEWRTAMLDLVSSAHTLGGITDLTFEVVDSHYADFAFKLGTDLFKWRWETYSLGPKAAAEVLSKHLIMPLISITHLAFSSADPVSELSESHLEKAVDKVGRTARRTVDTHVKHAIARPRVATTLRRMTAMFNFFPELPSITSEAETPDLSLPNIKPRSQAPSKRPEEPAPSHRLSPVPLVSTVTDIPAPLIFQGGPQGSPSASSSRIQSSGSVPATESGASKAADDDSVTESEDEEELRTTSTAIKGKEADTRSIHTKSPSPPARVGHEPAPERSATSNRPAAQDTNVDSSPLPPTKKAKRTAVVSSDDEDSEAERRMRVAQIKSNAQRGPKQPLKRGGDDSDLESIICARCEYKQ